MAVVQHCKDEVRLQQCANTIALMARKLSKDPKVRLEYKTFLLRQELRVSLCLSVRLSGAIVSKSLNLHLYLMGQSQVSVSSLSS